MSVPLTPAKAGSMNNGRAVREPVGTEASINAVKSRFSAGHSGKVSHRHVGGPSNRLKIVLAHITRYAFRTQARLSADSGVSPWAISRAMRGTLQPSLPHAILICEALARHSDRPLPLREIFSPDGTYPTPSVCELMGCRRCGLTKEGGADAR